MLPDLLVPDLSVVICGTAVGEQSAQRGHYYAGRGNRFWQLLYESGLTPVRLRPEDDHRVIEFGIGLTDLAKSVAASSDIGLDSEFDVAALAGKLERLRPHSLAFHGKRAAQAASRHTGNGRGVRLGLQAWRVAGVRVFVLPSASASNRDTSRLEGKSSHVEWFEELASLVRQKPKSSQ